MRNTVKFGMVSADKIMLSGTGIRLLDVHSTWRFIQKLLTRSVKGKS
jgi:hypothetical protein